MENRDWIKAIPNRLEGTIRIRASLLYIFASLTIVALSGCTRTALRTQPLWDGEPVTYTAPPEDRINVWPLFFYRDPVLSIFWPIFTSTGDAHALAPIYEADRKQNAIIFGTVLPILPPLARVDPGKYWRFLNVVRDGEDDTFFVIPIYFQDFDEKSILILPVFYKDPDDFWTPIYSDVGRTKGFLGPLFNVTERDRYRTYNFPFPLVAFSHGDEKLAARAFPIFVYDRDKGDTTFNLGLILAHLRLNEVGGGEARDLDLRYLLSLGRLKKTEDAKLNHLFPFWFYDRDKGDTTFNLGLILAHLRLNSAGGGEGRDLDLRYLLPLGRLMKTEDAELNYLVPFWFAKKQGDRSSFISLPFTKGKFGNLEVTNALLNGYVSVSGPEGSYEGVLAPIFQRFSRNDGAGHAVVPLYYFFKNKEGVSKIRSLPFNYTSDGSLLNIGGPIYYASEKDGKRRQFVAWPLISRWTSPEESGSWLLPLYFRKKEADGSELLVSPLGGFARSEDSETTDFLGPLYYSRKKGDSHYWSVAFPFWHRWTKGEESITALAPGFVWARSLKRKVWLSLPFSFMTSEDGHFFNAGTVLFHHSENTQRVKDWLFAGIVGLDRYRDRQGWVFRLFPFFRSESHEDFRRFYSIPFGVTISKDPESQIRAYLDSPVDTPDEQSEEGQRGGTRGSPRVSRYDYRSILDLILFDSHLEARLIDKTQPLESATAEDFHIQRQSRGRIFPLFSYDRAEGERSELQILWRLYNGWSSPEESGSWLLPLYFRKKGADGSEMLVTPLGGFARSEESQITDILGPLYYSRKKGDAHYWTVAFPFWSRWTEDEESGSSLLPLYFRKKGADGSEMLVTPLGGFARSAESQITDVLGPLYYSRKKGDAHYWSVAFPFWHRWTKDEESVTALAPVFVSARSAKKTMFLSLPFSFMTGEDESFLNVGAVLFHRAKDARKVSDRLLAWLVGLDRYRDRQGWKFRLFPFFESESHENFRRFSSLPFNVNISKDPESRVRAYLDSLDDTPDEQSEEERPRGTRGSRRVSAYEYRFILDLIRFDSHLEARLIEKTQPIESATAEDFHIQRQSKGSLYPLFWYDRAEGERSDLQILWRLFDSKSRTLEGGIEEKRSRVLWRVFHRTVEGKDQDVTIDAFPFTAYTRKKNLVKFSFMGGLFGYGSEDGQKHVRLLYMPIRW